MVGRDSSFLNGGLQTAQITMYMYLYLYAAIIYFLALLLSEMLHL